MKTKDLSKNTYPDHVINCNECARDPLLHLCEEGERLKNQKFVNKDPDLAGVSTRKLAAETDGVAGLLPCPFCNGEAVVSGDSGGGDDETGEGPWRVTHILCGNDACPMQPGIYGEELEEVAMKAWNTRANSQEWQPIETVPKDGTEVLLAHDLTGVVWTDEWMSRWGASGCWRQYEAWQKGLIEGPTHWMPLPAPPNPITQDAASASELSQDVPAHGPASLAESESDYANLTAQRDRLLQVLETRAERELEMLAEVAAENDALQAENAQLKTHIENLEHDFAGTVAECSKHHGEGSL